MKAARCPSNSATKNSCRSSACTSPPATNRPIASRNSTSTSTPPSAANADRRPAVPEHHRERVVPLTDPRRPRPQLRELGQRQPCPHRHAELRCQVDEGVKVRPGGVNIRHHILPLLPQPPRLPASTLAYVLK